MRPSSLHMASVTALRRSGLIQRDRDNGEICTIDDDVRRQQRFWIGLGFRLDHVRLPAKDEIRGSALPAGLPSN